MKSPVHAWVWEKNRGIFGISVFEGSLLGFSLLCAWNAWGLIVGFFVVSVLVTGMLAWRFSENGRYRYVLITLRRIFLRRLPLLISFRDEDYREIPKKT